MAQKAWEGYHVHLLCLSACFLFIRYIVEDEDPGDEFEPNPVRKHYTLPAKSLIQLRPADFDFTVRKRVPVASSRVPSVSPHPRDTLQPPAAPRASSDPWPLMR
jgi:hypothetical protein